ncbi:MAG: KOW domain-containing RNA-binding protein [Clostridia bacterium]|nr:KOW domain-containing RNA-binding protein [Clostridia bacterium]
MEISIGSVVSSKAGRDKGELFVVLALDSEYAMLANGDLRKVDKPKKKKLKHIQKTNFVSEFIAEKMKSSGKVTNSEVRKALAEYKPMD